MDDLEKSGKTIEFGEQLLLLIDRMEDMQKPKILARIMSAAAVGDIPLEKALRLGKQLDRAFSEDLHILIDFQPGVQPDQVVAASLFSAGLLTAAGIDGGRITEEGSGGTMFEMNEYGALLRNFGLGGKSN